MANAALAYEFSQDNDEVAAVRTAQNGDRAAFSTLYERHSTYVFNLVLRSAGNRDDANDICQEVWLTVHKQLQSLREPGAFGVWLRRIASRSCIDFARRRHSRPEFAVEDFESLGVEGNQSPEDAAVTQERGLQAWEALGSLAPRQGIALFLREVEGRSYKEIALALGASTDAVETLLFRARGSLSRNFESIETSPEQRCRKAKQVMASVMDGEVGRLAQMTAQAHLDNCGHCQREIANAKRGSMAYLGIPMATLTAEQGFGLLAATAGSSVGLGTLAGIMANLKAWLVPLVAATAVATTAGVVVVPDLVQDHSTPTAASEAVPPPQSPVTTDSTFGSPSSPATSPSAGNSGSPSSPSGGSDRLDPKAPATGLLPQAPVGTGSTDVLPGNTAPADLPVLVTTPELPAVQDLRPLELPALPDPQALLNELPVEPLLDGVQSLLTELPVAPLLDDVQTLLTELPVAPIVQDVQLLLPSLPAVQLPGLSPLSPQQPAGSLPNNSPVPLLPGLVPGTNPILPQLPTGPAADIPTLPSLPLSPQGGNPILSPLPITPLLPQGGGLPPLPIPPLLPLPH